jgi:retinol dehydrogenase 12
MDFGQRTTNASTRVPIRLFRCIWRQSSRNPVCPDKPRLDGKLALITGGNAGIGIEISRGLAKRGASVIIAARNVAASEQACAQIAAETGASMQHIKLDLSDLNSVVAATERLKELSADKPIDVLVANAGVWPKAYSTSAQGHEFAFATNTLGHHCLVRRLLDRRMLAAHARVVVMTGDIYIRADACTPDFKYDGNGSMAYCRSKLGNIWFTTQLQARYPDLQTVLVHPGVIASGLNGGDGQGGAGLMLLDLEAGAQTPLWCATQPGMGRAEYWHNTGGRMLLAKNDPAMNEEAAKQLWGTLEELTEAFR